MESIKKQYDICGVPVSFPNNPYSSQMTMMYRIINSLNKKENCLLELPTGSGKTMGLLCGTLSWFENNNKQKNIEKKDDTEKPIKIYFGSRTHKQIGQVVRELRKSPYSDTRMSIISGRKQTCVNNEIRVSKDIDQSCKDLCATKEGCYYKKKDELLPSHPWDIESIKPELTKKKVCPYFQMKSWVSQADFILCPYNYILNPFIRKAMKINLENAIVILDEAHNVEDICRDSYSISISQEELNICKIQLLKILKHPQVSLKHGILVDMLTSLDKLIDDLSGKLFFRDEDILKKTWNVPDFIGLMKMQKLDLEQITQLQTSLSELLDMWKHLREKKAQQKDTVDETTTQTTVDETYTQTTVVDSDHLPPPISTKSLQLMEGFFAIAKMLLDENGKYEKDFNIIITEGEKYKPEHTDQEADLDGVWISSKKRKSNVLKTNFVLNLWCMNPGIAFLEMSRKTHSVILTSGTLSPIRSFEKELDCKFQSVLEAYHVVSEDQTFIASIGQGPSNTQMHSIYKNTKKTSFQDELGRIIISCSEVVPNGILCFLTSFTLLETLIDRWTKTGVADEIRRHKRIFLEPRNSNDMDRVMNKYRENIDAGALLLAVYRGKASEGIDFADKAARLVITVGIPYPSASDPKVVLKQNYNSIKHEDTKNSDNQYLNGQEWYNIVAFRALNQAIGRCIRHRGDWGAMIMVDTRFGDSSNGYSNGLCKWIRGRLNKFENWSDIYIDLRAFVTKHLKQAQAEPALTN